MAITRKKLSILMISLLASSPVFANNAENHQPLPPSGVINLEQNISVQKVQLPADIMAPITIPAPTQAELREKTPIKTRSLMEFTDPNSCPDYNNFASLSGEALFNFIRKTSGECIGQLYRRNDSVAINTYQSSKVIDVARRAAQIAQTYDSSTGYDMYNLFYYLRGAFYVEYNNDQLTYQENKPHQAMLPLLEAYSRNPHISEVTEEQGSTLSEFFTTWDSSKNYLQSVDAVTRYLNEFSPEHLQSWAHRNALTSALTVLYRASWNATYTKAAEQHTALRQALLKVANSEYIYNSEYSYESTDALREYARFLEYQSYWKLSDEFKNEINNGIVDFMTHFERYSNPWAIAAGQLDTYNQGECEKFNICGWKEGLANQVLSIHYSCSDTIKIRAQNMTQSELQQSCDLLAAEETLFHKILKTGNQPVTDDFNTNLEVNIFDSADEYRNYAGTLFGISTDNGGMYLEGDPSVEGNQARFIAHEATWRDDILVWNLRHEYIHYLDGRFNMYGPFNYFRTDTGKSVWWSEGLAEYISHQNLYDEAIEFARQRNYSLSEVLNNNYSSDQDRIYRWGYLAVRFIFEEAPEMVDQLMEYTRAGDAMGWLNYINTSIGYSLDQRWYNWLLTVQSDDTPLGGTTPTPSIVPDSCKYQGPYGYGQVNDGDTVCVSSRDGKAYYYFYVNDDVVSIDINTDHGEGNIDLYYSPYTWAETNYFSEKSANTGNQESLTLNNPRTGWQYVTVVSAPFSEGASLKLDMTTN
ncbi:peptidase M9 [Photobacterium frigidiphilum]|uniref:microbial collagenase n=1 Tax=Photobacterium frigidiphilum TaxID=264736 RepID=A0A2T3J9A6_9GAMM|nr:M9 family metallopeptidase [Photobacterium frigidiphilum]PSU45382.1 peptidase M9 [Photobacterium frigidiphilum]